MKLAQDGRHKKWKRGNTKYKKNCKKEDMEYKTENLNEVQKYEDKVEKDGSYKKRRREDTQKAKNKKSETRKIK